MDCEFNCQGWVNHSEEFVSAREDLGHATGHLLPAIAVLVQNVLGLPVKANEEQKRIVRLERQLALAREKAGAGKKVQGEVARLQVELDAARAALDDALAESARVRAACGRACGCDNGHVPAPDDAAIRAVDAAVTALLSRPPPGVDAAYVAAFAGRHHAHLVDLVRARLGGTP